MSFCEHCQGQRFDRSRVLRALRKLQRDLRGPGGNTEASTAVTLALQAVRNLDLPHLETEDDDYGDVVH